MINMHSKKTKKVISAVLIIFIIVAMIVPTVAYFFA